MVLSNKWYDLMKKLVTLWLPALGTLIFSINAIWELGWPSEQIVATITAVCTFMGVILNISSTNYYADNGEESDDIFEEGVVEEE